MTVEQAIQKSSVEARMEVVDAFKTLGGQFVPSND